MPTDHERLRPAWLLALLAGAVTLAAAQGGAVGAADCPAMLAALQEPCKPAIDTVSAAFLSTFPEPPTDDQVAAATDSLRSSGLPAADCCSQVAAFVAPRCPCTADYASALQAKGLPAALGVGSTRAVAAACGQAAAAFTGCP
ncbi:Quinone oxidoreductase 2 [Micractinium conductrix]|uniref:Quinone oxidoreductase 2 n=1 Tax=Micractinium conductrix TaxID=554055 RepID=A0A2P6V3W0_9CHLO|nr:Quinone oxidoreductase 2 [Micractinium conductrix]|eukprot:PSC68779.1 Quinone oxidoreductase 2 [Micractinium conductrix]